MQINLMHHPDAFASLDEAFEPGRNVAYGAKFLGRSAARRRNPGSARSSATTRPILERGRAYREKVYERWAEPPARRGSGRTRPRLRW